MRFRYVPRKHAIPAWRNPPGVGEFPPTMRACTHAIVLTHGRGTHAYFRFWYSRGVLYAGGTWVHEDMRGCGTARELWRRVLDRFEPRRVEVRTISEAGRALIASVVKDNPGIEWSITT